MMTLTGPENTIFLQFIENGRMLIESGLSLGVICIKEMNSRMMVTRAMEKGNGEVLVKVV